jgi:hypothetical protein
MEFFDLKKLIIAGSAVVALIVGIIVLVNVFSSSKYELAKGYIHFAPDGDRVIVVPRGSASFEIDGYLVDSSNSLDGATAIALVQESRGGGMGNSLYLVTDKAQLIAEEVLSAFISASGNAVIYSTEMDSSTGTAELWQYLNGNHTRISNDFNPYGGIAVSPNGRTVAFAAYDDRDREVGYIWDGRLTELGRDIIPVAVSNGARQIYFIRDNVFFVQRGTNSDHRERLGDAGDIGQIFLNRDLSQVLYTAGSRTFISSRGGARESLAGEMWYVIAPEGTGIMVERNWSVHRSPWVYICDISDFGDTFYYDSGSNIVRINNRFETNNVARSVYNASLARNGRTLTFQRNDRIYQINGLTQNAEATELVSGDVIWFEATANGNAVFFVNDIEELFYQ